MSTKITIELSKAKTSQEIERLIEICDKLHNGEHVTGYSIKDLPPDSVYAEYRNKLNLVTDYTSKTSDPIMYMGSVPKEKEIKVIKNALIMPKFDGCSVALRFKIDDNKLILIQAHTRGSDVGSKRVNSDLTKKMKLLIPECKFKQTAIIKRLLEMEPVYINIRGEIVLKEKELDESGYNISPPAAVVAGKINGSLEVFQNYIDKIRICAFEISKIEFKNNTHKVPKQENSLKILASIEYGNSLRLKDYDVYCGDTSEINFSELFDIIQEQEKRPLDGLVYCDKDWRYPELIEDTTDSRYGKYAWKPNNELIVTIKAIEYNMKRDGDYSPMILFDKIKVDKSYERAKSSISKVFTLLDQGIGFGAKALLRIVHDINPLISEILNPAEHKFELPKRCIWCKSELDYVYDKNKVLMHLYCKNEQCPELLLQRFVYLISVTDKKTKLKYLNEKGKEVKSKISEQNLRKLRDSYPNTKLNMKIIQTRIPNFKTEFMKLSLVDQMYALGYGGVQAINKIIKQRNIKSLEDIKQELWVTDLI